MKVLLSLVLVFLITGGAVVARAQDTESERQTLKGLKGIRVLVENLEPEVELTGLTRAAIQTDVELKLRLAGIPVLTQSGVPYLYVQVSFLTTSDGYWPFHISVEFNQRVRLDRDRTIVGSAITWSEVRFGGTSKANVHMVRDTTKDLVDEFINAYLSVNPK